MSRLIDADALKETIKNERFSGWGNCLVEIDNAPTVDAVPVVRCKDCRWWCTDCMPKEFGWCDAKMNRSTDEDWYCADGGKTMSKDRLISANALENEVCHGCQYEHNKYENCIDCALAQVPTVDAVPVKHGEWKSIIEFTGDRFTPYKKIGNDYQWNDNHGELVRCVDCKHRGNDFECPLAPIGLGLPDDDFFCARGERKDDEII